MLQDILQGNLDTINDGAMFIVIIIQSIPILKTSVLASLTNSESQYKTCHWKYTVPASYNP